MAKLYPSNQHLLSSSASYNYFTSSKQKTFTIWMKSLLLNGKGCTVYDSDGHIMYRVDNYNSRSSDEVYLMDFDGRVLFTIVRKKFRLFGFWEGYRSSATEIDLKKPGFQVKKILKILSRNSECKVMLGLDNDQPYQYMIKSWTNKPAECRIVDKLGEVVAEVKRKETKCGHVLGEDVLTVAVKPSVDDSLIIGLLVVYNLINCNL